MSLAAFGVPESEGRPMGILSIRSDMLGAIPSEATDYRRPTDRIQPAGAQSFQRYHLDHPINDVVQVITLAFGQERTPLQAATNILRSRGHVDLLDVGCGTGHTLWTWGKATARAAQIDVANVGMQGVSLHDYRDDSSYPTTRRAHREGHMGYIVNPKENLRGVPSNSVDVTLAYSSIVYSKKPHVWVKEMVRTSRPGAVIYFELTREQSFSNTPVMADLFDKVDNKGFSLDMNVVREVIDEKEYLDRVLCELVKPS